MKNFTIILIIFLFLSCTAKDNPKKPDNLIPKGKMELILYDLYVINAAKGVNRRLLEKNGFKPETYVLTKHKIDSAQFADSNAYYAFNPDTYKAIVENVKAKLEKEKTEFEEEEKIEGMAAKRRRDSISEIKKRVKDSIKQLQSKDSIAIKTVL